MDFLEIENKHNMYLKDAEDDVPRSWIKFYDTRYVEIDYPKVKENMLDFPLVLLEERERLSAHMGFLFAMCPKDRRKMLVIDRSDLPRGADTFTKCYEVAVGTKLEVVARLLRLYRKVERVKLDYGDVNTLRSWEETYDVTGRVRRTTGNRKGFILVNNARSMGGGLIMTDCILSIVETTKPYKCHYVLNEPFTNGLKEIT